MNQERRPLNRPANVRGTGFRVRATRILVGGRAPANQT